MAESLAKDKGDKDNIEDNMAEWERRLAEGDLPDDFLEVTEPGTVIDKRSVTTAAASDPQAAQIKQQQQQPATGLLVDIPTVTASNTVTPKPTPPRLGNAQWAILTFFCLAHNKIHKFCAEKSRFFKNLPPFLVIF